MITTNRNISNGNLILVERIILPKNDAPYSASELPDDYYQFGLKIAEKNIQKGRKITSEPVFKWFNAPSREAAFEYAEANADRWVDELKAAVGPPKPKVELATPQQVNRMKFNGSNGKN